jgi:hypothetical protein
MNSFDLLKLRLAQLSFALPDLLSTESSQLRNFLNRDGGSEGGGGGSSPPTACVIKVLFFNLL